MISEGRRQKGWEGRKERLKWMNELCFNSLVLSRKKTDLKKKIPTHLKLWEGFYRKRCHHFCNCYFSVTVQSFRFFKSTWAHISNGIKERKMQGKHWKTCSDALLLAHCPRFTPETRAATWNTDFNPLRWGEVCFPGLTLPPEADS